MEMISFQMDEESHSVFWKIWIRKSDSILRFLYSYSILFVLDVEEEEYLLFWKVWITIFLYPLQFD